VVLGYRKLETIIGDFAKAQVLPLSAAAHIFDDRRKQRVRVATMDLRIGAIANRMTVLTRNTVDFQRIPNVSFEDWTVA
jgi:tRNA(fMet)-specific endonuclease VapC